jgi:hypothetical protein
MRRWLLQGETRMLEGGKGTERSRLASLGWKIPAWIGGVVFLGIFSIVLLYAYGDPRPTFVEAAEIGSDAPSIPTIAPGELYYRIRAKYIPMAPARETADPIGQLWASLFGETVSEAGAASVKLRLSHPGPLSIVRDQDGYILLNIITASPTSDVTTPFMTRRATDKVELRLDVEPLEGAAAGLMVGLMRSFGGSGRAFSGWVSVFADGPSPGIRKLDGTNSLMPIRDFSGRVVAAVRVSLETRRSMLFENYFSGNGFENFVALGASTADRRNAVLSLIERNFETGFGESGFKKALLERARAAFNLADNDADASCRRVYSDLSEGMGMSLQDAAGIAFLARYNPTTPIDLNSTICGDLRLTAALAGIGALDGLESANAAMAEMQKRERGVTASGKITDVPAGSTGRYVCLGVSGSRVAAHCDVLNAIAKEWRGGSKFLQMLSSRRFIGRHVGLEEPTESMDFAASRFADRRQLLIHISLSRIENFACFRMVRQNPDYFEALLMMRDAGTGSARRLSVFEFAFENDGRIGRIRRRAALLFDVEEARRLPKTSRCRQEFLDIRQTEIGKLVRDYWRLPPARS